MRGELQHERRTAHEPATFRIHSAIAVRRDYLGAEEIRAELKTKARERV